MIDYFKMAINKYADFQGRSRRSEYWYFVLMTIILYIVATVVDSLTGFPILIAVVALGLIIPSISVLVRRLHDTDRSGWWYFISFIPLIGTILLMVWLATDGTPGTNKWGRNPKEEVDDIVDHLVD